MKKRITIGIPCFQQAPAETLEDYMRFAFYLGRQYQDYDFFVAIKPKSEQFRARNSIVEAAVQVGSDYLLMLDDDHVIDWTEKACLEPSQEIKPYEFLRKLLEGMTETKAGIVGALYYHRGGECRPVVMKEGNDGGFYYMRDDEITGCLQEVAVTGGGCMLIDMNILTRIPSPWFEPEFQFGTDVQICKKTRDAGFKVYCDTSVVLGHVMTKRDIVTPKNRHRIIADSMARGNDTEGIDPAWVADSSLNLYRMDVLEYLKTDWEGVLKYAEEYQDKYSRFRGWYIPDDYYKNLGPEQIARQVWFHHQPFMVEQFKMLMQMINHSQPAKGLEYGCGSSPVGFELALKGHDMDLIDLDGTPAYEFTKWRAKKRGIKCGWDWSGDYDFILFLDSIEHLANWEEVLDKAVKNLKPNGFIITNFFLNEDYENVEHINMDKKAVMAFLVNHGVFPINQMVFMKKDFDFMTRKEGVENGGNNDFTKDDVSGTGRKEASGGGIYPAP